MNRRIASVMLMAFVAAMATPAFAYIGPGAGLSMLSALWGLLAAVVAALGFVIAWPLRRLFRKIRAQQDPSGSSAAAQASTVEREQPQSASGDGHGRS